MVDRRGSGFATRKEAMPNLESIQTRFPVEYFDSPEKAAEYWAELLAEEIEEQEAREIETTRRDEEAAAFVAMESAILAKAREIADQVGGVAHKAFSGSCYVMVDGAEVARVSNHAKPYGNDPAVENWLWRNGTIERV